MANSLGVGLNPEPAPSTVAFPPAGFPAVAGLSREGGNWKGKETGTRPPRSPRPSESGGGAGPSRTPPAEEPCGQGTASGRSSALLPLRLVDQSRDNGGDFSDGGSGSPLNNQGGVRMLLRGEITLLTTGLEPATFQSRVLNH